MRPTFDKLSHDAPTILNGTNEYEYVLVGTFHSVHNLPQLPSIPHPTIRVGVVPIGVSVGLISPLAARTLPSGALGRAQGSADRAHAKAGL